MKKLQFSIDINGPKEKVWDILWNDESYRKWTSVFGEGSYAVSNWQKGDKILFLGAEGEGMYSVIDDKKPNEFMSFKHLGVVKNGEEQPLDEGTKAWAGSKENYILKGSGNKTNLMVEIDVTTDFESYFQGTFPKALQKIKELSET